LSTLGIETLREMTWLGAALTPEWTLSVLETLVAGGNGVLISDRDTSPIGVAAVRTDAPTAGSANITFLGIDPARRFRGLGGEAGLGLDRWLRGKGYQRVYAPVPEGRGLAIYFWLRLGFRPLTTPDAPGPVTGLSGGEMPGIWMLRDRA
jgi:GNAT superfamily N-acetyltransferase